MKSKVTFVLALAAVVVLAAGSVGAQVTIVGDPYGSQCRGASHFSVQSRLQSCGFCLEHLGC